jgi:hypothetical protein
MLCFVLTITSAWAAVRKETDRSAVAVEVGASGHVSVDVRPIVPQAKGLCDIPGSVKKNVQEGQTGWVLQKTGGPTQLKWTYKDNVFSIVHDQKKLYLNPDGCSTDCMDCWIEMSSEEVAAITKPGPNTSVKPIEEQNTAVGGGKPAPGVPAPPPGGDVCEDIKELNKKWFPNYPDLVPRVSPDLLPKEEKELSDLVRNKLNKKCRGNTKLPQCADVCKVFLEEIRGFFIKTK